MHTHTVHTLSPDLKLSQWQYTYSYESNDLRSRKPLYSSHLTLSNTIHIHVDTCGFQFSDYNLECDTLVCDIKVGACNDTFKIVVIMYLQCNIQTGIHIKGALNAHTCLLKSHDFMSHF